MDFLNHADVLLRLLPGRMIGGTANLPDLFVAIARQRGLSIEAAFELIDSLPSEMAGAPCFLNNLVSSWSYLYGEPIVAMPDGSSVVGSHMCHPVERLFDTVSCLHRRFPKGSMDQYLRHLKDPTKHEDALLEFAPILRLSEDRDFEICYEVAGEGTNTIDWSILEKDANCLVLVEVKNRVKDLIQGFARIEECVPADVGPEPIHDPAFLFKSIEKKFSASAPTRTVHVAWIKTHVKQEESELNAAFRKLDSTRVHVVVLGDWADDAYVLSNDPRARQAVLELFRLVESRRFVFTRGELAIRR